MEKGIYCDLDLCVGCGACVVACMDENDVNLMAGDVGNRRIHRLENPCDEKQLLRFVSVACNHCEDSPCLIGCPTGAIRRDDVTGAVVVNQDICIGCHSCALACPFGVPRYDAQDKLVKCDLCSDRVAAGLAPACVRICPFSALKLMAPNEVAKEKEGKYVGKLMGNK